MNACLVGGGAKEPILRVAAELLPESTEVLIIPSACSTPASYERKVGPTRELFARIGLRTEVLHDLGKAPTDTERAEKFGRAAMIYVIGGHTPTMMETIRRHGTDADIRSAARDGSMLAGVSAGALLPFHTGHVNPARSPLTERWDFEMRPMLGLMDAAAAVHADKIEPTKDRSRLHDFTDRLPMAGVNIGFAIENGAAMLLAGGESRILRSHPESRLHVLACIGDVVTSRRLEDDDDFTTVMRGVPISA